MILCILDMRLGGFGHSCAYDSYDSPIVCILEHIRSHMPYRLFQ